MHRVAIFSRVFHSTVCRSQYCPIAAAVSVLAALSPVSIPHPSVVTPNPIPVPQLLLPLLSHSRGSYYPFATAFLLILIFVFAYILLVTILSVGCMAQW